MIENHAGGEPQSTSDQNPTSDSSESAWVAWGRPWGGIQHPRLGTGTRIGDLIPQDRLLEIAQQLEGPVIDPDAPISPPYLGYGINE
jgi:hypothetical protein